MVLWPRTGRDDPGPSAGETPALPAEAPTLVPRNFRSRRADASAVTGFSLSLHQRLEKLSILQKRAGFAKGNFPPAVNTRDNQSRSGVSGSDFPFSYVYGAPLDLRLARPPGGFSKELVKGLAETINRTGEREVKQRATAPPQQAIDVEKLTSQVCDRIERRIRIERERRGL